PGGADRLLDLLRGRFADQQVVLAAEMTDDRLVHLVTADADAAGVDDVREREHGDFGRATADIDDHAAGRLRDRQARADGGGDRFGDEDRLARAGREDRVANRPLLDGRGAIGDADDDDGLGYPGARMHLADE